MARVVGRYLGPQNQHSIIVVVHFGPRVWLKVLSARQL
jgi:hypothetical protein